MPDAASPLDLARVRCAAAPRAGAAEDLVVLAARADLGGPESADNFALPGAAAKRAIRDSGGGFADDPLLRRDLRRVIHSHGTAIGGSSGAAGVGGALPPVAGTDAAHHVGGDCGGPVGDTSTKVVVSPSMLKVWQYFRGCS